MDRRTFLGGAVAGMGLLAGCAGGGGATTQGERAPLTDSSGRTPGPNVPDHDATAGIAAQPRLGNFEGHTIVAFEDPSCTRCRAFERDVVPRIRSNLVDGGSTTMVVRGYPVVYPWGEPACQALEAVYAREPDAFWQLWHHYFDTQPEFDEGNVLDRTETFLAAETSVDAAAVVSNARERTHDSAVQTDLDAGMAAGAGRTTPSLFFFRDGEYVTKAQGSVSYQVVASALGE